jgi:hypothetical protein
MLPLGYGFLAPQAISFAVRINHFPGGHVQAQCLCKNIYIPKYENAVQLLTAVI